MLFLSKSKFKCKAMFCNLELITYVTTLIKTEIEMLISLFLARISFKLKLNLNTKRTELHPILISSTIK